MDVKCDLVNIFLDFGNTMNKNIHILNKLKNLDILILDKIFESNNDEIIKNNIVKNMINIIEYYIENENYDIDDFYSNIYCCILIIIGINHEDSDNNIESAMVYYQYCANNKIKKYNLSGNIDIIDEKMQIVLNKISSYYRKKEEYSKMKYYCKICAKAGNLESIMYMAKYYQFIEKDDKKVIKYYTDAMKQKCLEAVIELFMFSDDYNETFLISLNPIFIEEIINLKNKEELKIHLLSRVENDMTGLYNLGLGILMQFIDKNYDIAEKYFERAVYLNCTNANEWYEICKYINIHYTCMELIQNNNINECTICKTIKPVINFNCNHKFQHYYCTECFLEWYKCNKLTCLLCFTPINRHNFL